MKRRVADKQPSLARMLGRSLFALVMLVALWPAAAGAADAGDVEKALKQPADFRACLEWTLGHSPKLKQSALEIKVRRLGEWDSAWDFAPSIQMYSRYFFGRPEDSGRRYELKFSSGTYNPVGAYFTLQAQKLVRKLAVYAHLAAVEEIVNRLANSFVELSALDEQIRYHEERIRLAQRMVDYTKSLKDSGSATGLQMEVAEQGLEVAQAGAMALAAARQAVLNQMKVVMGLDPQMKLAIDVKAGVAQVLAGYDVTRTTLPNAQKHSLDLHVQRIKELLQDLNITLAYTKFLPTLQMNLENPDPLVAQDGNALYFSVGIEMALFEGFRQVRNVQRQKMVLKQFKYERRHKELVLTATWQGARDRVMQERAGLKLTKTRARLAGLRERESFIDYRAQQASYAQFASRRMDHLEAQGNLAKKQLEYRKALLDLRRLCGDLMDQHIEVGSEDLE